MSIGNFKETNENAEANEAKENTDNTEKPRNQILETPEDYDDDFDKKLDSNEESNEQSNEQKSDSSEAESEKGGDNEKHSVLDRLRNMFSKRENNEDSDNNEDANESDDDQDAPDEGDKPDFKDSLKVTMSPEEVKKYNEEHGVSDIPTERPKGGFEREPGGYDPRWDDSESESDADENN